ncbi:electron transport complex subunit RsxA [Ostreibacterium oceani]|uniref:electron transport complex subunit RsxA n=1 Tax=Ostreibacterium oceani TaxID=2654998 RepID=UPI0038B365DE
MANDVFTDSLYLLISAIFIQNLILTQFLGLCPFLGVSNKMQTAVGMGIATAFVLTLSTSAAYMLNTFLLIPYDLGYLRTITYITIVAILVGLTEIGIRHVSPLLHRILGIYLPLITSNCAVLGVMLISTREQPSLFDAALFGLGGAVGFSLVLVLFAAIRERLLAADIPQPFVGAPIAMITAGIMAIAFMGFHGM